VQGNSSTRAPRALSRVETDEASSRSYCAQLTIYDLSIHRVADGTRVFLLRTAIRQNRTLSHRLSPEEPPRAHRPHSHLSSSKLFELLVATPRTDQFDQRSLYDGFLLHSTTAFGPRSKVSRSPS
jgi:hypothetical protein